MAPLSSPIPIALDGSRPLRSIVGVLVVLAALTVPLTVPLTVHAQGQAPLAPPVPLDVPFVPTPAEAVAAMLKLADVKRGDVVYDLGSGDGRIVITAARRYGAKGTGIDIDPVRIKEATANARAAGVDDRVRFIRQDLFDADFREATVVTLYLLPRLNQRLRPKLLAELKPGTRVVSYGFDMGDWAPAQTVDVGSSTVYLWVIPPRTE